MPWQGAEQALETTQRPPSSHGHSTSSCREVPSPPAEERAPWQQRVPVPDRPSPQVCPPPLCEQ